MGDLLAIELVGFGLGPVDGPHVERMAEDEGDALLVAKVGKPLPGEHAFTSDDKPLSEGFDGLKEIVGPGGDVLMQQDFSWESRMQRYMDLA